MASKNINILIVEDLENMRKLIWSMLLKMGYDRVTNVPNAAMALRKLRVEKFDLVIADWNMPEMSGLELLDEIRKDPKLSKIPFLMVTVESEKEKILEAMAHKVDGYIVKPFSAATLEKKIEAFFLKKAKKNN